MMDGILFLRIGLWSDNWFLLPAPLIFIFIFILLAGLPLMFLGEIFIILVLPNYKIFRNILSQNMALYLCQFACILKNSIKIYFA